ncbi:electron transfer flavoprotein subunit alpha/FixB family protein [Halomicrobium salinisoli]|uniref:electron transfer flavoprotein subunit alpha/FixB family protein n=1 Tax=Halomicrobium salinisoli TaxID=2878391 RepID=UPI001CF090F2|nr:electron transfer flavoprotein subunit alpha/FixB family protein [Halomicrobium salinisoli]
MTVLAVAEHRRGELRDVSFELITAGRELAREIGGDLRVAVVNGPVEDYARTLSREAVDVVHTVDHGAEFNHDVYVQAVAELTEAVDPTVLLLPHTADGMDYAPAVASRLGRPLLTDAVDLAFDDRLAVTRERYGATAEATIEVNADRAAVTLRPTEWPPAEYRGDARIEPFAVDVDEAAVQSNVNGYEEVRGDVDLEGAGVVVAVGRGVGAEEDLDPIFELADALDAVVGAARPVIDAGWLGPERQVGTAGTTVDPEVYLALGISGAPRHVAGVKGAETVVAVNEDPAAPIFDVADYGVVGDLFEVVPALLAQFR